MVSAEEAIGIYQRLIAEGIQIWLTGGWGIDALLQEQTRPHKDLDIIMLVEDVSRMRELLAREGYQLEKLWPENRWVRDISGVDTPTAFVLQDLASHQVDAHAMRMDDQGNGIPAWCNEEGLIFEMEDLAGCGVIAGVEVGCLTPEMQVVCHTGYDLPDYQKHDVKRLHLRFDVGYPGRQPAQE